MTDSLPEPFATISRMRLEGINEKIIAETVGLGRDAMWDKIAKWNRKHPELRVPKPENRRGITKTAKVLELYRQGLSNREIAVKLKMDRNNVSKHLCEARANGQIGPRTVTYLNGQEAWQQYMRKGAAPKLGNMSEVLRTMSTAELDALLRRQGKNDKTMAAIIARTLKEVFNDART